MGFPQLNSECCSKWGEGKQKVQVTTGNPMLSSHSLFGRRYSSPEDDSDAACSCSPPMWEPALPFYPKKCMPKDPYISPYKAWGGASGQKYISLHLL